MKLKRKDTEKMGTQELVDYYNELRSAAHKGYAGLDMNFLQFPEMLIRNGKAYHVHEHRHIPNSDFDLRFKIMSMEQDVLAVDLIRKFSNLVGTIK